MADYPSVTTLSGLNSSPGLNDPSDNEVVAKLDDSIRQLKSFVHTFLGVAHDDSGNLKANATTSTSLGTQVVEGTTANSAGTAKHIKQGTISTPDFRASAVDANALATDAVTTAKIAAQAVTAAKIANATITVTQMANDAVEEAIIKNDAVTAAKLKSDAGTDSNRAVTTNHIRDAAVTLAKMASASVNETKLAFSGASDAAPKLFVGGTANVQATVGGILSATLVGTVLTFALSGSAGGGSVVYTKIEEKKSTGTNMGASVVGGGNTRGAWSEVQDGADILSVSANSITFKKAGTYLLMGRVPAYSVGSHRARFTKITGGTTDVLQGSTACAAPGAMSHSFLAGVITVAADNDVYEVRQWCEKAQSGAGLGLASNDGQEEIYSVLEILKI